MITFQDFIRIADRAAAVSDVVSDHMASGIYRTALDADEYDKQKNVTIMRFQKLIYRPDGSSIVDRISANHKIPSNIFHKLNVQRAAYSLGNGITFPEDGVKDRLGSQIDTDLFILAKYALIHGLAFGFWNMDHLHVFPVTEFAPLWDEDSGSLRAGVRFWRLANDRPMTAVLYEEDGYSVYKTKGSGAVFGLAEEKRPYKMQIAKAPADEIPTIASVENYSALPIIPLYGSSIKQSTLVGLRGAIDAYDLIRSGFANDVQACGSIYWLMQNANGMEQDELTRFLDQLMTSHIANVDDNGVSLTPYTPEPASQARAAILADLRAGMYEDFGALDVTSISAAAKTATEITAAYQPMDDNADDFEYQIIQFVRQLLRIAGIPDSVPTFKRNRIANINDEIQAVVMEAPYLDPETILNKLPNITPDEIPGILERMDAATEARYSLEV